MSQHAILIGDPSFFRIKAGKNPYTRSSFGFRKKVNLKKAIYQWQKFSGLLESLGAKVFVVPPNEEYPSMVFPANAGFLFPKYARLSWSKKVFYLSHLSPHRQGEAMFYKTFLESLKIPTDTIPYPFEGEADFFPAGDFYIFSHGTIVPTGFQFSFKWPFYGYQFSHRSDVRNKEILQAIVEKSEVISVRLVDTRYYHGDTALFSFGKNREYLFAYLPAIDLESRDRLEQAFGKRLIPLSRKDAENFVANSFQLETPDGPHIIFPSRVSEEVKKTVSLLGIPFSLVDVSEFFEKGGGSIKCLLCDLGPWYNSNHD